MRAIHLFLVILFCIPLLLCTHPATGQEAPLLREERAAIARESIKALYGGTLIVRLPSYQTKIDGMKDILSSSGPDSPNRKRVEKLLEATLADRKEFNQNMMAAFEEVYGFSSAYFMLDTATAALKSGRLEGIFLNSSLDVDPTIQLDGAPPYFVLRFGSTSDMSTDGVEAMVIMNS